MALLKPSALQRQAEYEPQRLSRPQIFLWSMLIFLVIVGFIAAILYRQISVAFASNPGLNGLIIGVLIIGIFLSFYQIIRLMPEVRWVNAFRAGDRQSQDQEPVMLAPMKALMGRRQSMALSTASLRSILDSIAARLDEARDISRYLIGLLVFLGLLGTFWGLLATIGSIGSTIQSLDPGSGNANDVLDSLKAGLSAPLAGMGTAFSSSLFGLAGSLVLGFLDLQAGRAQNRFYTELENWLSTVTDLGSDLMTAEPLKSEGSAEMRQLYEQISKLSQDGGGKNQRSAAAIANLADGIQGLVKNMRGEQQMMRDWVEAQAEEQRRLRETLDRLAQATEAREPGE